MSHSLEESPNGIGGWLIVPLIGLIIAPIRFCISFYVDTLPLLSQENRAVVAEVMDGVKNSAVVPLLIGEQVGDGIAFLLGLVALWLFLKKSRYTPLTIIGFYFFVIVVTALDFVSIVLFVPEAASLPDAVSFGAPALSTIVTIIWIAYFLFSRRVKATFVN